MARTMASRRRQIRREFMHRGVAEIEALCKIGTCVERDASKRVGWVTIPC